MTASEHVGIRTLFISFRKQLSLETFNTRKFLLYSNVLDELAPPEIQIGSRGAIVKERPASFATRGGARPIEGRHECVPVHFDGLLLLFNATRTLSGPPSTRASIALDGGVTDGPRLRQHIVTLDGLLMLFNTTRNLSGPPSKRATITWVGAPS